MATTLPDLYYQLHYYHCLASKVKRNPARYFLAGGFMCWVASLMLLLFYFLILNCATHITTTTTTIAVLLMSLNYFHLY